MHKFLQQSLCANALLLAAAGAQAGPTIINGGFETGDFTGWSLVEDLGPNTVAGDAPHSGDYSALLGETGTPASLAQTLTTEAGHSYTVTFWLSNLGGSANNSTTSNTFQMLAGGDTLFSLNDKTATNYTQYHASFTAASSATSLTFSFKHDETFWLLDDVSISELSTSPVPEPSAPLMLTLGLGLVVLTRRLR